jgi:hypothetical protein
MIDNSTSHCSETEFGLCAPLEVLVIRPASGVEAISLFANRGGVEALAISPNGKYMASGGPDKTVLVWKLPESNAK